MHIRSSRDLKNLKINMNEFESYYKANGGCAFCGASNKGGGAEPQSLSAKDFMDTFLPLLRGGYSKKQRKSRKKGGAETISTSTPSEGAENNFFHVYAPTNTISSSSYPDLNFKSYSFPAAEIPQFR